MTLMLLTGVAGPLLDAFFLGGRLDRRAIVATKAICQFAGHGAKLVYFGVFATEVASLDPQIVVIAVLASIAGTAAARPVLLRLSDSQYRVWATRLVAAIAAPTWHRLRGCSLPHH